MPGSSNFFTGSDNENMTGLQSEIIEPNGSLIVSPEDVGWQADVEPLNLAKKSAIHKALLYLQSTRTINLTSEQRADVVEKVVYAEDDADTTTSVLENIRRFQTVVNVTKIGKIQEAVNKALKNREEHVKYDEFTIEKNLRTMLGHALRQYNDLNRDGLNRKRRNDVVALNQIIENQELDAPALINNIRDYFASPTFSPGIGGSRLESLVKDAITRFERPETAPRTLQLKIWQNTDVPSNGKVVLAIPGLEDSVDTFNKLAPLYADKGYNVISYDQAKQGFDELRSRGKLDLKQMQLDFYSVLEQLQDDPQFNGITLMGHSLGGAVIAHSLPSINNINTKIEQIEFLAPATMKNPIMQLIGNLWTLITNPSDMTRDVKNERLGENAGIKRIGGTGISIGMFFKFRAFVENAFYNLVHAFNSKDYAIPMTIHYDRDDGLVSRRNFDDLRNENKEAPKKAIGYVGGRHHLHAHQKAPEIIAKNMKIAEPGSLNQVDEDTDNDELAP